MSSDNDWFDRDHQRPETLDAYRSAAPRRRDYQRQHWLPAVFVVFLASGMVTAVVGGRDAPVARPDAGADADAANSTAPNRGFTAFNGPSLHIHADNPPDDASQAYYRHTTPKSSTSAAPLTYYQCIRGGQKVYSDAPCSVNATVRTLDTSQLNHYSAPPPERRQAHNHTENYDTLTEPHKVRAQASAGETQCRYLEKRIEDIDARMRAGYASQEGEYLREQRREATDAYHEAHCTKF